MTSIDVRERPTDSEKAPPDGRRQKAVLFCPVCGHESPVDGSWIVSSYESQQKFRCPECEQVVAVR